MDQSKEFSKGAIFIMPRSSTAWNGAEALWITVAGWAAAAQEKLGHAWIVTTDRIASADEVIDYPLSKKLPMRTKGKSFVPHILKTFIKDILLWTNRNRKSYNKNVPWQQSKIAFVWEQHDLFHGPGRSLANALGVPLVLYVHAPVIWEASKWKVKRPLWGWLLERYVETRSLRTADLIACVSAEVAEKLITMGVMRSKIIVSPMSVDPRRFRVSSGSSVLYEKFNLENKFVIGWTGSFRGFHGLDTLVKATASMIKSFPEITLLLIGDGSERNAIADLVDDLGIKENVVLTGRVPFTQIPRHIELFDVAVVSADRAENFHYSSLKLREFLVSGKATIAPRAGEIPSIFNDEEELLLYKAGDAGDLKNKIARLYHDDALRLRLGSNGKRKILTQGTWDYELQKVMTFFDISKS